MIALLAIAFLAIAVFAGITALAVYLLKQFDKVAGRGPKQVADGIRMEREGWKDGR